MAKKEFESFPTNLTEEKELYKEPVEFKKNTYTLDDCTTEHQKTTKITTSFTNLEIKLQATLKQYLMLQIFTSSVNKDNEFNRTFFDIDKKINLLKRIVEESRKRVKILPIILLSDDESIEELYSSIGDANDFCSEIDQQLESFKDKYYTTLRYSCVLLCQSKTVDELNKLYKAVSSFIGGFSNPLKAKDYIFYHSSDVVYDTIQSLIKCCHNINIDVKTSYFLKDENALTFTYREWNQLINKIFAAKNNLQNVSEHLLVEFEKNYQQFECFYVVLTIADILESQVR